MQQRVVVVGAGAVGMACGLTLRRDGHDVVVLDPRQPGEGASFGNAGIIANCTVDPLGMPDRPSISIACCASVLANAGRRAIRQTCEHAPGRRRRRTLSIL